VIIVESTNRDNFFIVDFFNQYVSNIERKIGLHIKSHPTVSIEKPFSKTHAPEFRIGVLLYDLTMNKQTKEKTINTPTSTSGEGLLERTIGVIIITTGSYTGCWMETPAPYKLRLRI
tara:strand:+ start:1044 stop:1394 length:351 start_codon:yes stop_codon:yes gene_type:complete